MRQNMEPKRIVYGEVGRKTEKVMALRCGSGFGNNRMSSRNEK